MLPIVQVPTQPQLEIEKEPTADIQPTVEPMTSKPRSVPIPDSFRTCVDVRSKEMKIPPLPKEASSTSLCTSTIKLPCYYAENLDSLDIARYLFKIHYERWPQNYWQNPQSGLEKPSFLPNDDKITKHHKNNIVFLCGQCGLCLWETKLVMVAKLQPVLGEFFYQISVTLYEFGWSK